MTAVATVGTRADAGEDQGHATLSASGAYRWWACVGSVAMEAQFPASVSSVYAQEGTIAHALAHLCLIRGIDAIEMVDRRIDGHTIDSDMADAVQVYLSVCRDYSRHRDIECFTEKRFNLRSLNPPVPMFGTADFTALSRKERKITIVDLKFGKGIAVEAQDNPQLKYYGLGVMLAFPNEQIDTVETVIVQPRVSGNPVKRATYDAVDILGWSVDLIARAVETTKPNAPLTPGPHCRFCRAGGACPAQAEKALLAAQIQFQDLVQGGKVIPPDPARLTSQQIGMLLAQADVLDTFIKGLKAAAQSLIENGEAIPGWKVVPKRASRKWKNEDETPLILDLAGIPEAAIWKKELLSPAQAETQLTAIHRAAGMKLKDAETTAKHTLKDFIIATSSGGTLAVDSDARPALPSKFSEFEFENAPSARALPGRATEEFGFEANLPVK